MSLTWGELRSKVRRSVLQDIDKVSWSDEVLLDLCGWALDHFCSHTALKATKVFADATGTTFEMPDDVYESPETAGLLLLTNYSTTTYLAHRDDDDKPNGTPYYWMWPDNVLNLSTEVDGTRDLILSYFAHYPHPEEDSDLILVPQWAEMAIAWSIGAEAMVGPGVGSAIIRQWNDKKDSGIPSDNPLRAQNKWMLELYQDILSRHERQDRVRFFSRYRS